MSDLPVQEVGTDSPRDDRTVYEHLYWFVRMVQSGGPDGSDLDLAVYEDGIDAADWIDRCNPFGWYDSPADVDASRRVAE